MAVNRFKVSFLCRSTCPRVYVDCKETKVYYAFVYACEYTVMSNYCIPVALNCVRIFWIMTHGRHLFSYLFSYLHQIKKVNKLHYVCIYVWVVLITSPRGSLDNLPICLLHICYCYYL